MTAVRVEQESLSNTWWPLSIRETDNKKQLEKMLTLWFNSTFGFVLLLTHRIETEGAWLEFKKPVLEAMPVLNPLIMSQDQIKYLSNLYDEVSELPLQAFPLIAVDEVRKRIDDGIAHALSLPDFSVIRELLAKEPIISLNRL